MAVELERGLHAIVAKSLTHSLDVDALLKQQRGVRVTESMQSDRRQRDQIADASTEVVRMAIHVRMLGRKSTTLASPRF